MDYLLSIEFIATVIKAIAVIFVALQVVPGCIYFERKIAAYVQGRLGPNRVNFVVGHLRNLLPESMHSMIPEGIARFKLIPGSLQPLADAIKLAFKEEIVPERADKVLYYIAPALAFIPVGTALCFLPFGSVWTFGPTNLMGVEIARHSIEMSVAGGVVPGLLLVFAISSLGVYGITCGGWGSGSKFPLMAAARAVAQTISYEVPLGIAFIIAIASAGSVDGQEIVRNQAETWGGFGWLMFRQPLAAFIFMIAMFAENNRLPFDLPEAEPELVGGYHTEYSGLKFAVFFLGEYCAMILMCGLFVTLFMGGWSLPFVVDPASETLLNTILSIMVFSVKLLAVLWLQLWIRWTLPRFRYDQLMALCWKRLTPLALANLAVTAFVLSVWPTLTFLA